MTVYNGYPSWNSWNVNLWIESKEVIHEHLNDLVELHRDNKTRSELVARLTRAVIFFLGKRTPDGAIINRRALAIWLDNMGY